MISITVGDGNEYFCSQDDVLFSRSKTRLICYPAGKSEVFYSIPVGVTIIDDHSFSECDKLTDIIIPGSVTTIGSWAFDGCDGLTDVVLPNGLISIGENAFTNCGGITRIKIPGSVTSIGEGAFVCGGALDSISVSADNQYFCSVGGVLFNKEKTELIQYPSLKSGKSYTIPGSVRIIGAYAFYSVEKLTTIKITKNVKEIRDMALSGWEVKKIIFEGNAPSIASDAFWPIEANAYYPDANSTWTKAKRKQYGGKIKWVKTYFAPKTALKSVTTPRKGWIKVVWKAIKGISGYQLQVSETKDFKKGKQKSVKPPAKEKNATFDDLKSGKTYYVRMRTYKKKNSKTYYGEWSKAKSVKVK